MRKIATFIIVGVAFGFQCADAQDIAGLEDCTKTDGLDKRTGCFQSNIEYLNRAITKNMLDVQRRLKAATTEIGVLKGTVAGLQKTVEQLQNAAKKPDGNERLRPSDP